MAVGLMRIALPPGVSVSRRDFPTSVSVASVPSLGPGTPLSSSSQEPAASHGHRNSIGVAAARGLTWWFAVVCTRPPATR